MTEFPVYLCLLDMVLFECPEPGLDEVSDPLGTVGNTRIAREEDPFLNQPVVIEWTGHIHKKTVVT